MQSDCIVGCIEHLITSSHQAVNKPTHLEPEPIFRYGQMTHFSQIPSIDITPSIPLSTLWDSEVIWEISFIFVRLDYVSDPEYVDVGFEPPSETSCGSFAA